MLSLRRERLLLFFSMCKDYGLITEGDCNWNYKTKSLLSIKKLFTQKRGVNFNPVDYQSLSITLASIRWPSRSAAIARSRRWAKSSPPICSKKSQFLRGGSNKHT